MKLKTLQEAKQFAFDESYKGLKSQKFEQCTDSIGFQTCQLTNDEGMHCAIGWLLNENAPWSGAGDNLGEFALEPLKEWWVKLWSSFEMSLSFFCQLQICHDGSLDQNDMKEKLEQFATKHNLKIPE